MTYETMQMIAATFGLILFMAIFIVVVFKTYHPSAKAIHEEYGKIPFNEED